MLADAGYGSHENIDGIGLRGGPIIKTRKMPPHGKRKENTLQDQVVQRQNNAECLAVYRKRQGVERLSSLLKDIGRSGKHTRRRQARVTLLCLSSLIVVQT